MLVFGLTEAAFAQQPYLVSVAFTFSVLAWCTYVFHVPVSSRFTLAHIRMAYGFIANLLFPSGSGVCVSERMYFPRFNGLIAEALPFDGTQLTVRRFLHVRTPPPLRPFSLDPARLPLEGSIFSTFMCLL